MKWEDSISRKANNLLFKAAWAKAQKARVRTEKLLEHFFEELVTIGIDVEGPPNLARFTPTWKPLSDSWVERKGGDESFYFKTGALEEALIGKNTTRIFGRPQIFLDWSGGSKKVDAGVAPQKYQGTKLTRMQIRIIPFPKWQGGNTAEELAAAGNDETYYKLVNPHGEYYRPLVTPFVRWYVAVRLRNAMRAIIK